MDSSLFFLRRFSLSFFILILLFFFTFFCLFPFSSYFVSFSFFSHFFPLFFLFLFFFSFFCFTSFLNLLLFCFLIIFVFQRVKEKKKPRARERIKKKMRSGKKKKKHGKDWTPFPSFFVFRTPFQLSFFIPRLVGEYLPHSLSNRAHDRMYPEHQRVAPLTNWKNACHWTELTWFLGPTNPCSTYVNVVFFFFFSKGSC